MSQTALLAILLFPLLGGTINAFWGGRLPRAICAWVAVASVAASALTCMFCWPLASGQGVRTVFFSWLQSGDFQVSFSLLFDRLSAPMALMVTLVSTLIHIYAIGYMKTDTDHGRFFALMNWFVFAMLIIVLSDDLLFLFLGWEGVGFCSYALIGYWYREKKNADAGRKAFLVTRIGDVFLLIAILWIFKILGTTSISELNAQSSAIDPTTATILVLLFLGGAMGKSAQLPLMTWLPDAMAGPTPVSALIHAATMVTAGVYLLGRVFPLLSQSPTGMAVVAVVGAATAFYAATCALAQREIKRVLAYSTMSQIGYMFFAVGCGAVSAAMFHLFAHAFYKALLFMGAGCVIHLCGGENDLFKMGGLRRRDPLVFFCFVAGACCLAGVPLTGGFFSKDAILRAAFAANSPLILGLWGLSCITALLTAMYAFRLVYLVFAGESRSLQPSASHALPGLMRKTLVPLAVLGLFAGLMNWPEAFGGSPWFDHWLGALGGRWIELSTFWEWLLTALAVILVASGYLYARKRFNAGRLQTASPRALLLLGWGADWVASRLVTRPYSALSQICWKRMDQTAIDGGLDGLSRLTMGLGGRIAAMTSGRLSHYLLALALGLLALMGFFVARWWMGG